MKFFDDLISIYSKIKFPKQYDEISKIDKSISWYYADKTNQFISSTKSQNYHIIELDIKNAFTTICNCLFEYNDPFIIEMNKRTDKKDRNIFIAINLRNTEYLRLLNIICKVCIMGTVFECGECEILELKKDGAVVLCDENVSQKIFNLVNEAQSCGEITNFLTLNSFKFHVDSHLKYIRSNRTSYFLTPTGMITKGIYKHTPLEITKLQYQLFSDQYIDLNKYIKIYTQDYFDILVQNGLMELLKSYYLSSELNYLTYDGKYSKQYKDVDAKNYLRTFIYPIILSNKI